MCIYKQRQTCSDVKKLIDNDKEKVLRDVSFIGNLAMIISLNYKKKCINANDPIVLKMVRT